MKKNLTKLTVGVLMMMGVLVSHQIINDKFNNIEQPVIRVEAAPEDFILEYTTTAANQTIILPFRGTTNVSINWNNGQSAVTHTVGNDASFTYPTIGTYQIVISGSISRYGFEQFQYYNYQLSNQRLIKVIQWGSTGVTSLSGMFMGAQNLAFVPTNIPTTVTNLSFLFHQKNTWTNPLDNISSWDVSRVTDFSNMFNGAGAFNTDISSWNTSSATNMAAMFIYINSSFNQDLSGWDVSNVTNFTDMWNRARNANPDVTSWNPSSATHMSNMFFAANKFNRNINGWDVSSLVSMSGMFYEASIFNQPLNSWDVSNVTSMAEAFRFANAFNQPLNNWNVGNVTDFNNLFSSARAFNQDISSWDVSKGTNFSGMFSGASAFNQSLSTWNVANATSMYGMFEGASVFNQPLNTWNTSKVTNMAAMFNNTAAFNQPLNNWDVSKVTNFSLMFRGSAFNQDISNWNVGSGIYFNAMFQYNGTFNQPLNSWNMANAINIAQMFQGTSFNQPLNNWNTANVVDMNGLFSANAVFNQDISSWNTGKVTNTAYMFNGAKRFNQNISTWDVSKVTNFAGMFNNTDDFNQPIGVWDTSAAQYTYDMFANAKAFNSYIGEWDMSRVINMSAMFSGTSIFNSDISGWTTSEVQYMASVFANNVVFNQPIGDWNTAKVISMEGLFQNSVFNQPIGNWNVGKVTNMFRMFQGNQVFNQPIANWDVSKVQYFREMFQYAIAFDQDLPWTTTALTLVWNMFDGATAFNGDISTWNMTLVTSLSEMFLNAQSFNQPINNWNVSNVTSFYRMFRGASSFNQPLDNWNTSLAQDMERMFENATAFDQDLGTWDFRNVYNLADFMGGSVNLNPLNYDSILQRFSDQTITLQNFWGRNSLSFGQSKYSKVAKALKDQLIADRGWSIYDGGELRLTISVNDEEIYFGGSEPTYSVSYEGLVLGAGEDTMTNNFNFTRTPGTAVGDYTVSVTGGDETYYYVTYETGTLSILKPEIDISNVTWNYEDAFVYNGSAFTVTLIGVPNLVTVQYTGNSATNAGEYVASVTITYDTANYELVGTIEPLTWVIEKATYDMSGVTWNYDGTPFTYDQTEHTVTITGLPNGVTVDTYEGNEATQPGEYTATVTFNFDAVNFETPVVDDLVWEIFAPTITITFDSNGGTTVNAITGIFGSNVTPPANPTRTGFIFNGWSTLIPTTMPNADVTIVASWRAVDSNNFTNQNLDELLDLSEYAGQDISIELIVELLETSNLSESDQAILDAFLRDEIGSSVETVYYDIQLLLNTDNEQILITETAEGFEIILNVPENFQDKDLFIVQMIDGVPTMIEGTYDPETKTIRFVVDKLGAYALAYESFNLMSALVIGGGAVLGTGLLGWLFFILFGKRRRQPKQVVAKEAIEIEEDESMENVTVFQKPITITQAFFDTLSEEEKMEFRQYFVDDSPNHLVKELVYKIGEMNEAFFMDVYKYLYRFRKLISIQLLKKMTEYGLVIASKQPKAQTLIYEAATKTAYARRKDQAFLELAIEYARKDIALQRNVLNPRGIFVYSFYRLSIILEKQKLIKEALVIVNEGIARELIDKTKGGFEGRKARLLSKQTSA